MNRLSLRARLFLLLIVPLVIIAAIGAYARYQAAQKLSRQLYDKTLLAVALTISRDVIISEGDMLTEPLLEELTTALGDPVYYRITGPGGSFVTGYSHSPGFLRGSAFRTASPVSSTAFISGVRSVRSFCGSSSPIPALMAGSPLKCGRPQCSAAR